MIKFRDSKFILKYDFSWKKNRVFAYFFKLNDCIKEKYLQKWLDKTKENQNQLQFKKLLVVSKNFLKRIRWN